MATIFPQDGKWYINYRSRGKRVRRVAGKTKREAEKVLKEVIREQTLERLTEPQASYRETSLSDFCNFLFDYVERHKSPRTAERYSEMLTNFRTWAIPNHIRTVGDIRPIHVESYTKWRQKHKASQNTIRHELIILSQLWRIAMKYGYAQHNPITEVERPKKVQKAPRFLDKKEIAALLKASNEYERAVWKTYLYTGMRRGELETLEWQDVDFRRSTITVRVRADFAPKGRRSRGIPMHPKLKPVLKKLPKRSEQLVFATKHGTRLKHYDRNFKRACEKAGIEGTSIHTLRHTCASHLVMAGVDLPTVAKILGHRDIESTMVYAHLTVDHLKAGVERLDLL